MQKLLLLSLLLLPACLLQAQQESGKNIRKEVQTQLIMAEKGDTIRIPAGVFTSDGSLSLDEKEDIVIMGAGMNETLISFKDQTDGAEGLRVSNCRNIQIIGLTIEDAKGDCIKVMATEGIYFYDVRASWSGKPEKTNGAYGFYPVSCTHVIIDHCEAVGASDAGIYVGQSHNIIVRHSKAYYNVAGIEIENSTLADVHDCEATNNTGGILVFDLPDLPKKKGGNVRVFNNYIHDNNYKNFAPPGNTVATVPPGTGLMILATNDVEAYGNRIINNITAGTAIISYYMTETPIKDAAYYPYPTSIYVHDNTYSREVGKPTLSNRMGKLLFLKFGKNVPDILYDGIIDPAKAGDNGQLQAEYRICIQRNGGATFANLDAGNNFKAISREIQAYDCSRDQLDSANPPTPR